MSIDYIASPIAGVGLIAGPFFDDARGGFTKVFSTAAFESTGTVFDVKEVYWSRSHTGVIRGMHYQKPPAAVAKIVFTAQGRIRDVVLDLRIGSPTYKGYTEFELTERSGALLIPQGCAHGFEVLAGPAITCYLQDGPFDPHNDEGVRWDSVGIAWTTLRPVVSDRDKALPVMEAFDSPFSPDGPAHVR